MRGQSLSAAVAFVGNLLAVALLVHPAQAAPRRAQAAPAGAQVRTVSQIPQQINPANLDRDPVTIDDQPVTLEPQQAQPATPRKQYIVNGDPEVLCPNGTNPCASCNSRAGCSRRQVAIQQPPRRRMQTVSYVAGCAGGACAAGACGAAAFGSRGGRGPVRRLVRNRPRLLGRIFGRRCR